MPLKQADKLQKLIKELEAELKKDDDSKTSFRRNALLTWLIACHTVGGNTAEVESLARRLKQD